MGRACSMHGQTRNPYEILDKKKLTEDLGVHGVTTLEWMLRKHGIRMQNGFKWLRVGSSGGL
jgi:hypothetical protein